MRINIPQIEKKKNNVLVVDELAIGYNHKTLAAGFDFNIKSGEKIIIVGDNGQGKSTFLKTIAEEIKPTGGKFSWFAGLKKAYYAQLSANDLNPNEQVGDYLRRLADTSLKTEKVLQMAGDFLFSGDDLKKPIGVLSGGEKSRLILAGLLLGKPDVLILDEPTNHLDFETVEALGLALSEFNGTIIFTSHDRTFANMVADGIIEINEGKVKRYYHGYEDYVAKLEKRLELAGSIINQEAEVKTVSDYELKKEKNKKLKSLENKLEKLQKQKEEIFKHFNDNPINYQPEKIAELEEVKKLIDSAEAEWLELSE